MLSFADLTRRAAMFSYVDGEEYVFMDNHPYTCKSILHPYTL
jgi:elongation factor P